MMKIAILHGYLLHGSGSNIYVQNVTKELVGLGHDVHLFCQERHPENYPFIKKAICIKNERIIEYYHSNNTHGATLINPDLDLLPVYVMDIYPEFKQVKLFIELSDEELEEYIKRNISAYTTFFDKFQYDIIHANHLVMMPYFASYLNQKYQVPYVIVPHGSSLVYTIQKDPRYKKLAIEGLHNATYIIPGNANFRDRILQYFEKDLPNLQEKMRIVPLGVDTNLFSPIPKEKRKEVLSNLINKLSHVPKGKPKRDELEFIKKISAMRKESINEVLTSIPSYSQKAPDESITDKLRGIDPLSERILIFFGRLILGKGIHNLLASLLPLLTWYDDLKVIIVGAGPMREWGEWFIHAGGLGNIDMVKSLIEWGKSHFNDRKEFWDAIIHFFESQDETILRTYHFNPSRVIFTGFLDHTYLAPLLALADWACFPSLVPESFGLVLVEAASCGVIPVASYFSGFKEILDHFKERIPQDVFSLLTIPAEGKAIVFKLIDSLSKLIEKKPAIAHLLREVAVNKFSWKSVTIELEQVYLEALQKS